MAIERSHIWPQLGVFFLLAIGAGIVWGVAAGFFASLWEIHYSPHRQSGYEQLFVTADGQPLIGGFSYAGNVYRELPYRTVDGEVVERKDLFQLEAASLPREPGRRPWLSGPITWNERLASGDDGERNVNWFLIRDNSDDGRSYFAGYDQRSRLTVGYISRKGFTSNPPAESDYFNLDPGRIVSTGLQGIHAHNWARQASEGSPLPYWCVYFLEDERLLEVDLRARHVRTLLQSPDMISLGMVKKPVDRATGAADREWRERLAVRSTESIVILDPAGDERNEFALPEELQTAKQLALYMPIDDQPIIDVQAAGDQGVAEHRLIWLNADGKVEREQVVEVVGYRPASDRQQIAVVTLVVPTLLVWAIVLLAPMSIEKLARGDATAYGEALRQSLADAWPALVALLILSLIAAWLVARLQRKYDRPYTLAWCVAVFLCGVPGLIAYLIHHGRTHTTACPNCRRTVPQRRDSCAACGDPFPQPALTGLEVFA